MNLAAVVWLLSSMVVGSGASQATLPSCGGLVLVGSDINVSSLQTAALVDEFKGIPFAHPPVGPLRFAPTVDLLCPEPINATANTFDATSYSNPCVQIVAENVTVGEEDCLYLNIYRPRVLRKSKSLVPVLVYIHGGSLIQGSGVWEQLQFLSAFAGGSDTDITERNAAVVVTINYRLGVLGFLATQAMCRENNESICGNYGIQDQLSALRWVQRHISSFGGDPKQVNVMGQSSGGTSIFALLGSPRSAGLFRSGISLSGSPNMTMRRGAKLAQDLPVVDLLGCGNATNDAEQLLCLRRLPASATQLAMPASWNTPALFSNQFLNNRSTAGAAYPALAYVDGTLLTRSVWEALSDPHDALTDVALVFGSMGQECNLVPADPSVANFTQVEWLKFIATQMMETWPEPLAVAWQIDRLYADASRVNPQLAYDSFNADYGLSCATFTIVSELASTYTNRSGGRAAPVYAYINQQGPQRPAAPNHEFSYAFHTWDYTNACHNWGLYIPHEEDLALSRLQRSQWYSLWANGSMDEHFGWPPVTAEHTDPTAPPIFLYAQPNRYPFRRGGATGDPYAAPGLCPLLRDGLGMDQRYWWVN
jgi:carboxylesterase type B